MSDSTNPTPARLHISGYAPDDRRTEPRIPSSIPAGINGQRDFDHTALIRNTSRTGALLVTNHHTEAGQTLHLSFQMFGQQHGAIVPARVVRVESREGGTMWKYEVGVQFEEALGAELLGEIEKRAQLAG